MVYAVVLDGGWLDWVQFVSIWNIAGSAVTAALGILVGAFWEKLIPPFYRSVVRYAGSASRLKRAEGAVDPKEKGLWIASSIKIAQPNGYLRNIQKSSPIIVVANLKGGVGKTTTVANLIGHYAAKKRKRVLAIDLDFQGSLTGTVVDYEDRKELLAMREEGNSCQAALLVTGRDGQWIRETAKTVNKVPDARCISAYYTLSNTENRVMIEWLIGKTTRDIRYDLARALLSPAIQDRFDIILIDAPPRLTTASIQAFCTATHVIVPTVLDGVSAEAAGTFVDQLVVNERLWPALWLLGIVGNMTDGLTADENGVKDRPLKDYEDDARVAAQDAVASALASAGPALRASEKSPMFPIECFIPNKPELGRQAGREIIYRAEGGSDAVQQISRAFDRLGDEIDRRIEASRQGPAIKSG